MSKKYVKYFPKYRTDGSYDVVEKDKVTGKLTIDSNHDTLKAAEKRIEYLHSTPSQADVMKMLDDYREQIKQYDS